MRSKHLLITIIATLSHSVIAQEIGSPPKEWWKEEDTIQDIEARNDQKINILIQLLEKNDNGMNLSKDESRELIELLKKDNIKKSEKWQFLKSQYQKGDIIVRYEMPSESDACGYLLVRNDEVIVNVVIKTNIQTQHETHTRYEDSEKDHITISGPSPVC